MGVNRLQVEGDSLIPLKNRISCPMNNVSDRMFCYTMQASEITEVEVEGQTHLCWLVSPTSEKRHQRSRIVH
jgi:hypothetical protein